MHQATLIQQSPFMFLINKHTIDVCCTSESFGYQLKDEITQLIETKLYPKMENLLQQYNPTDTVWQIDHLPVVIPKTASRNWKSELVTKTLSQIEDFLKADRFRESDTITTKSLKKGNTTQQHNSIVSEQLFLEYLQTGILKTNPISDRLAILIEGIVPNANFINRLKETLANHLQAILRWSVNIPDSVKKQWYTIIPFPEAHTHIQAIHKLEEHTREIPAAQKTYLISFKNSLLYLFWVNFFNPDNHKEKIASHLIDEVITIIDSYFGLSPKHFSAFAKAIKSLHSLNQLSDIKLLIEQLDTLSLIHI